MERKEFIRKFALGGSILFAAPAIFNSCARGDEEFFINDIIVDLNDPDFSPLGTVGGYVYLDDKIIIRTGDTQYVALSKVCTHQGCTVDYDATANLLPCPCHGSIYDISGAVINGPAPRNLESYNVKLDGNTLVIS